MNWINLEFFTDAYSYRIRPSSCFTIRYIPSRPSQIIRLVHPMFGQVMCKYVINKKPLYTNCPTNLMNKFFRVFSDWQIDLMSSNAHATVGMLKGSRFNKNVYLENCSLNVSIFSAIENTDNDVLILVLSARSGQVDVSKIQLCLSSKLSKRDYVHAYAPATSKKTCWSAVPVFQPGERFRQLLHENL